jgi:hypothetical protein
LDDDNIQKFLMAAAKDPTDPGLRGESVGLLMRKEDNGYVRLRCEKALRDMRASPGTF